MKGKLLLEALTSIEGGNWGNIFQNLPTVAGGDEWCLEIMGCASAVKDYLTEDGDYNQDTLLEFDLGWAGEAYVYYFDIHERVHALSLWASPEIDDEIEAQGWHQESGFASMTTIEGQYLTQALIMLWRAVVVQAFDYAEAVV